MPNQIASGRNQSMDCFKFLASLVVVLMHIRFPGDFGKLVLTTGYVAVPVFFAITGYFNYKSGRASVIRRIKAVGKLYLFAFAATAAIGMLTAALTGENALRYLLDFCLFGREELFQMLLLHFDPRNGQLWYLLALIFCYVILLLYLDFYGEEPVNYHPLYILGGMQFLFFVAFGMLSQLVHWGPPEAFFRSGYTYGGAFFTFGIFVHEYQERIMRNFRLTPRKLILLYMIGLVLSYLQAFSIGMGQLTLGGLLDVIALMMLLIACPRVPRVLQHCAPWLGRLSMYVFVLHIALIRFYDGVLKAPLLARLGNRVDLEGWLAPLIVLGLSLLCAILCDLVQQSLRRLHPAK